MKPLRKLGQHFLFDPSILRRIVEVSGISEDDLVVEIGPGYGDLTRLLAEKAGKLIAIEIDKRFSEKLKKEFIEYKNVEIIHSDALKFPYETLGEFRVVSNIPYYITTPLIFRLLESKRNLLSMTLTVQKEVAQRMVARPGSKEYGVLSIILQYRGKAEIKFFIPRGAFRPVPHVDSAVINIEIFREPPIKLDDEWLFFRTIRTAFSQRRKMLYNSLRSLHHNIRDILLSLNIDPSRRPETLTLEEYGKISNTLSGLTDIKKRMS